MTSTRNQIIAVFIAMMVFATFIGIIYVGNNENSYFKILNPVEKAEGSTIVDYSRSTIAPKHDTRFRPGKCACPTTPGAISSGFLSNPVIMGQGEREGNSPYTFDMCKHDAQEMINFLQDAELFAYSQSITHGEIGDAPPQALFYSWDEEKGQCNFYVTCEGMKDCDKTSVASGMVISEM